MGQYEFSKAVIEKILRRAFLDGVIELYENSPFGRIYSVALEGDLSLTINKYETFDIRLFEIAQRAPEKKPASKIFKTEPSTIDVPLKTEETKQKIKNESNAVTSPVNIKVANRFDSLPTEKVSDSKTRTESPILTTSKLKGSINSSVKTSNTADVTLLCPGNESSKTESQTTSDMRRRPSLQTSPEPQASLDLWKNLYPQTRPDSLTHRDPKTSLDPQIRLDTKLSPDPQIRLDTKTNIDLRKSLDEQTKLYRRKSLESTVSPDPQTSLESQTSLEPHKSLDRQTSLESQKSLDPLTSLESQTSQDSQRTPDPQTSPDQRTSVDVPMSPCMKPVYIYDDVRDDEPQNATEIKFQTRDLQISDDNHESSETILIDDEEEVIAKQVPRLVSESKVKRRRTDRKRSIQNRLRGQSTNGCDSSSSPADNFYNVCPLCSALFRNRDYFVMHVESHRQQLGQSCLICSQGNLQTEGYLYHLATHHGTSLIQAAADMSGLGQEGLPPASLRQAQFPVVNSEGEFRCLQCGRDFLTIGMLESHAESHRLEDLDAEKEETLHTEMMESTEMSYSCELCSEVFAHPGSLAEHHRQEHGLQVKGQMSLYVNDHTDDSSSEESFVVVHKGVDVFTCHRCGRSFRSWRSLKYHYLTTHGLQYTCEVCRNAFSSQRHLQAHEQTHVSTSAEPVFKCNICGKTFPTVTHCTAHKRSHTSAKPHTCDLCGSCFFKRGDLTKHVRTVHCPKKHFICKVCGRTGTRSDNMRVHVKLHQKFMNRDQVDQLIEEVYNK